MWGTDFTDFCDVTFPVLSVAVDDMRMCEFTNEEFCRQKPTPNVYERSILWTGTANR